jgi:hypothetical protein
MLRNEILLKEDARCLPWSREENKLASSKLGVFSKPAVLEPMRYDALVLTKGKHGVSKKQHDSPFIMLLKQQLIQFPSLTTMK